MKVYPVEGRSVPHPRTRRPIQIPADGLEIPPADELYWQRRVNHRDVATESPAPAPEAHPSAG